MTWLRFPSRLPRRTFLRGALGGAAIGVGLPTLQAMLNGNGTALASADGRGRPLPKRLGVFFWGNGVRHKFWVPAATGRNWMLSDELEPLAKVKRYLNVVSGMEVKTGNEQGHHAGTVGILSGCPMVSQPHPSSAYASTFSGPSIDQVAAAAIAGSTPFRSLEVGVSRRVTENEGTTLLYLSHRGPDAPNPPEYDPRAVFQRLFGAAPAYPRGPGVLDAVAEDARALSTRLGVEDRQRMDQHLGDIRELERRVSAPRPAKRQCLAPDGRLLLAEDRSEHMAVNAAMARVIALALSCDLTRVFSFMFSGSVGETSYPEVGQDKAHHQLTHDEPGDQPLVHAATVFIMRQFAALLEALAATPDGAGNLLDRSVVLASSDTADGREHSLQDYPVVIAGGAGGALRTPGIHYRSQIRENTSKVLLTVLRAAGVKLDRFGNKGGQVEDGLGAIEA